MNEIEKKAAEKNQKRRKSPTKKTVSTKATRIGKAEYINKKTGEIEQFNVIEEHDQDFNFQKIWLGHLLDALEMVGNKKMQVISWLLENRDKKTNEVIATQQEIIEATGLSKKTVAETFKALQEAEVLSKIRNEICFNRYILCVVLFTL